MEIEINENLIKDKVNKIVEDVAFKIFTKSQENLTQPGEDGRIITDTSELLTSGSVTPDGEGYIIKYSCPHAPYIEYGMPPTSIPVEPLIRWSKRKLGKTGKEAESIAWAIRTKISQEGCEPRPFLRNALYSVINES